MQQEIPSSPSPILSTEALLAGHSLGEGWAKAEPPPGSRVVIIRSSYYPELVSSMEESAKATLREGGIQSEHISSVRSPGAFEIPLLCKTIADAGRVDGIIALGVIVQGETHHAGEVARACTDGILEVQLSTGVPIAHAVLYVTTLQQAKDRCLGRGNKGVEAARSLLQMTAIIGSYTRS